MSWVWSALSPEVLSGSQVQCFSVWFQVMGTYYLKQCRFAAYPLGCIDPASSLGQLDHSILTDAFTLSPSLPPTLHVLPCAFFILESIMLPTLTLETSSVTALTVKSWRTMHTLHFFKECIIFWVSLLIHVLL